MVPYEPCWQTLSDDSVRALYSIAAGEGKGEALFGNSFGIARDAYEHTLIGDGYPAAYLDFPSWDRRGSICSRSTMQRRVELSFFGRTKFALTYRLGAD